LGKEMRWYLVLFLSCALFFAIVGWAITLKQMDNVEHQVMTNCVWLDFVGVVPEYCDQYIDEGYSIYEK
jgi:hypothetical protein